LALRSQSNSLASFPDSRRGSGDFNLYEVLCQVDGGFQSMMAIEHGEAVGSEADPIPLKIERLQVRLKSPLIELASVEGDPDLFATGLTQSAALPVRHIDQLAHGALCAVCRWVFANALGVVWTQ
jgi:hypothetical protein